MTLEELKQDPWYQERPELIKQAIDMVPPIRVYALPSGYQCYILSYDEPESGKLEHVTVTVQKTGEGGPMPGPLNANQVFGVLLTDLNPDFK